MTVGVDLRVLAKGTRSGVEEYLLNLLPHVLAIGKSDGVSFKLFYNAWQKVALDYPWLADAQLFKFSLPNRFVFDPLVKILGRPRLDRMIGGVDFFLSPHFLLGPVSASCRQTVVFHDLSFEYFPEFFSWPKRFWHWSVAARQRAAEADKIIAVSNSTKNDLVDLYGVASEKVKVIYSGVGEEFKKAAGDEIQVKQRYRLPEKFILYFGTLEPRKNLVGLIRAYEIFRQEAKLAEKYSLVIAGRPGWLFREILRAAQRSPFGREIIFTGFVEPADKVYLYNLASLFVFPSFFEGFGFPPLEAMACGLPTITSFTSSFPEVVGEAALMVDPYNFEEIAWAMGEILRDERLRNDYIAAGLEQAKKFSWDRCARETLEFLIS